MSYLPRTEEKIAQVLNDFGPNNGVRFAQLCAFASDLEEENAGLLEEREHLFTWLEWANGRLSHLKEMHDRPASLAALFGPKETMNGLEESLPKIQALLDSKNDEQPLRKIPAHVSLPF